MKPTYFPKYTAVFALFILNIGALDTFIAAVYEHTVILPNKAETPVSKEEALLSMNKNIDILEKAVKLAAKKIYCSLILLDFYKGFINFCESVFEICKNILLLFLLIRVPHHCDSRRWNLWLGFHKGDHLSLFGGYASP